MSGAFQVACRQRCVVVEAHVAVVSCVEMAAMPLVRFNLNKRWSIASRFLRI